MPYYTAKCRACGFEMPVVVTEYIGTGEPISLVEDCPECCAREWYKPRPELVANEADNWKFQVHGNDMNDPRLAEVLSEAPIQRNDRKRQYFYSGGRTDGM